MKKAPFYERGLRFSCVRCSVCCRYESGFVFLSRPDLDALSFELKMKSDDFIAACCRWIGTPEGFYQLSLREKSNYDCIFWKDGCTVYKARPRQCRSFPFWPGILESPGGWKNAALSCPGMGKGSLYTKEQIETCLHEQLNEAIITREHLP
jgi:Fe-S-cluster containining protein